MRRITSADRHGVVSSCTGPEMRGVGLTYTRVKISCKVSIVIHFEDPDFYNRFCDPL